MTRKIGFSLICLLFLMVSVGCVISPRRTLGGVAEPAPTATPTPSPSPSPTPTPAPVPSATGKLYVSSRLQDTIVRFDNAFTASGNVAPGATINGGLTGLTEPIYLALDSAADRLFVANRSAGSITVLDQASAKTGNIAPSRTISGAATNLLLPTDLVLDKGGDLLYVADDLDVLVFAAASTANGNVAVARDIQPGFAVGAIFLDTVANRLFVADPLGNAIDVYDNASSLNGPVTATRQISGVATGLSQPAGIRIDGAGRLIVSNASPPSIVAYNNAASASGNLAPSVTISGSNTGLVSPNQIAFDPTGTGTLYVADPGSGKIAVFANFSSANGNIAPTRSISGNLTGLSAAGLNSGIALDVVR